MNQPKSTIVVSHKIHPESEFVDAINGGIRFNPRGDIYDNEVIYGDRGEKYTLTPFLINTSPKMTDRSPDYVRRSAYFSYLKGMGKSALERLGIHVDKGFGVLKYINIIFFRMENGEKYFQEMVTMIAPYHKTFAIFLQYMKNEGKDMNIYLPSLSYGHGIKIKTKSINQTSYISMFDEVASKYDYTHYMFTSAGPANIHNLWCSAPFSPPQWRDRKIFGHTDIMLISDVMTVLDGQHPNIKHPGGIEVLVDDYLKLRKDKNIQAELEEQIEDIIRKQRPKEHEETGREEDHGYKKVKIEEGSNILDVATQSITQSLDSSTYSHGPSTQLIPSPHIPIRYFHPSLTGSLFMPNNPMFLHGMIPDTMPTLPPIPIMLSALNDLIRAGLNAKNHDIKVPVPQRKDVDKEDGEI